jgi:thiol-disulfide isomerase/thioredoxin
MPRGATAGNGGIVTVAAVGVAVAGALAFALWPQPDGGTGATTGAGDVLVIARGQEVSLANHLSAGKYTLIDFYADWCPNCRRLNPLLEDLAAREPRLAIRKVNILSWDSPVARQFGLQALPHLILYGPGGERIAEGEAVWQALSRLPA